MDGSEKQKTGRTGEAFAAWLLEGMGYRLVARNVRTRYGEIDLIALAPDGTLCIVEVRTTTTGEGTAFSSLSPRKRSRLARQALVYLAEQDWRGPVRIDFMAHEIHGESWVTLHCVNAFGQGGRVC